LANSFTYRNLLRKNMLPQVAPRDLHACLASYGLRYQELEIRPLAEGLDNLNLLIEGSKGRMVLRRYDLTHASEVAFEVGLVIHLRRKSFPTPDIIRNLAGGWLSQLGSRPAALFQYIDGRHGRADSVTDAHAVVDIVSRLHSVTEDFIAPCPRSRNDVNRIKHLSLRREQIKTPTTALDDFLRRATSLLVTLAERREKNSVRVGVVHHDPNPGNLLFGSQSQIVALLDFDESHIAPLMIDLASVIHYWASTNGAPGLDFTRASELVKVYCRSRKLSVSEQSLLPDYVRLFYAADAAEYLLRQISAKPNQSLDVESCHSYQRFMYLSSDPKWSERFANLCFGD
jgi:homoserine kinase type II